MGQLLDQALENVKTAAAAEELASNNEAVAAYKASLPATSAPVDAGSTPASSTPAADPNVYTQAQYDAGIAAQKAVSDGRINVLQKHNDYLEAKVVALTGDIQQMGVLLTKTNADLNAKEDTGSSDASTGTDASPATPAQ